MAGIGALIPTLFALLVLRNNGSAVARYEFTMPSTCGPSFKWYVNAVGTRWVTASHSGTTVRVVVHATGRGVVVISLVSIYYYC